ncbi:hypothetical protein ACES2L_14455 [Bdellovibrio bacteriovorus]
MFSLKAIFFVEDRLLPFGGLDILLFNILKVAPVVSFLSHIEINAAKVLVALLFLE